MKGIRDGTIQVDQNRLFVEFLKWQDKATVNVLHDLATGDRFAFLSPKRGNLAYARKQNRKLNSLMVSMARLKWDFEVPSAREKAMRKTHRVLITFTYDQNRYTCQEAWSRVTKDIKKFKVQMTRIMGMDEQHIGKNGRIYHKRRPSGEASVTVKEGTLNGYPAPHMIVLLDHPVLVFRHQNRKGEATWRVQSNRILLGVKSKWQQGFIDIQGVVNDVVSDGECTSEALPYLFKYLAKAYKMAPSIDIENLSDSTKLALVTHAWNKLFRLRSLHISKQFKERTNPQRLDYNDIESQQRCSHYWTFEEAVPTKLTEFCDVVSELNLKWFKGQQSVNKNMTNFRDVARFGLVKDKVNGMIIRTNDSPPEQTIARQAMTMPLPRVRLDRNC